MPLPPKAELEKKAWFRFLKVLYILFILMLIGYSVAGVIEIYDNLSPSYDWYFKTTSGSWEGAFLGGAFAALGFAVGIFVLHKIIKTTFFYILYGKKEKTKE